MTAREYLLLQKHFWPPSVEGVERIMIEFAQLHVKEALKEAYDKIKDDAIYQYGSDTPDCWNDESILNAYPKELIK